MALRADERRDKKHLQQAKKVFEKMEHKDPVVAAYEKQRGKSMN